MANDRSRSGGVVWGVLDVPDSDMGDYKVVSWAIEELRRKQEKPFFLACGIFRPHLPWYVPQKYVDLFPLESIQLPKTLKGDLADVPRALCEIEAPWYETRRVEDVQVAQIRRKMIGDAALQEKPGCGIKLRSLSERLRKWFQND